MKIAITGASGFIGRELAAQARAAGHEVIGLARSPGSLTNYEDADALARAFAAADTVMHLAARAHVRGTDADFECNVRAARAVAQAARTAGVRRLVLLSSIGVNGNATHGRPFTESDAPAPVEPYSRSKLRAEAEVQTGGVEWVIVRPPLVHGPDAPGNFARLVNAVARGTPLPLASVHNLRSLAGRGNLCDFLLVCAAHPAAANQSFVIADGDDLSTPDIVHCISEGLRRPAKLWHAPVPLLKAGAALLGRRRIAESLCDSLQVDSSKARDVLGWKPATTSREGITRAAAEWSFA